MLRIQKYVAGKDISFADALSRLSQCKGETIAGVEIQVHELHLHLNASPTRIDEIRNETAKNIDLNSLRAVITHVWPDKRSKCSTHLYSYWNYRDKLKVTDGLILKGTRIIFPSFYSLLCLSSYTTATKVLRSVNSEPKDPCSWQT